MKFGKTLDYSMMLTAPLRESLHWKSYKMPRPDQPDGLRRMPGPVAGLHGDRVGEPRHQAGPSVGRARTTSCLTSRSPGPAKPKDARCQESRMLGRFEAAVRGGADNFTTSETSENVTKVIAVQAKGMLWEGCWVPWKTLGRQQQYRDRLQSTTFQSTSAPGAREDG